MTLNELEIIQRTAQAKCGRRYIITLDALKKTNGVKAILLRVEDNLDTEIVLPIVLPADSTLSEVCETAMVLASELQELDI